MTTKTGKGGPIGGLWRVLAWGGAAALLLAPLVAMQFSEEVQWTGSDFAIFAVILAIPLGVLELVLRTSDDPFYQAGVIVALGTAFLITWSNLAVGIIGNEENPLNLVFFGLIALVFLGAMALRFRARGMAAVMAVAALGQVGTAVVAMTHGDVAVVAIGFFTLGWLLSAYLFREAAERRDRAA